MLIREDFVQQFVSDRGLLSIAELFHENTKIRQFDMTWSAEPSDSQLHSVYRQVKSPYKRLRGHPVVALGAHRLRGALARSLRRRRSVREFTGEPVTRAKLSALLRAAVGITGAHHLGEGQILHSRAAPSAGSLFPLEMYVIVLDGKDLTEGVYHYAPREHALELLQAGDVRQQLFDATLKQSPLLAASVVIAITAISVRSMFKYGERGYRYLLLEAGHIGQNLYLVGGKLGLGGFTVGGFVDDVVNGLLRVDGVNEYGIYLFVAGARPRGMQWRRAVRQLRPAFAFWFRRIRLSWSHVMQPRRWWPSR